MRVIIIASLVVLLTLGVFVVETSSSDAQISAPVEKTETTEPLEPTVEIEPTEPTVDELAPIEPVEPISDYLGEFVLTAYCACKNCCGKTDGVTATGTIATAGRTIAVDPKVIPYGSEVIINDHIYIAEDCGGGINNYHIDIYFDSHEEALQFGVQYADIYIVRS